jgi:hypothetical protein
MRDYYLSTWDMASTAKTSNPPLSKEMFLQTQGQTQDCWEDDEDAEDDHVQKPTTHQMKTTDFVGGLQILSLSFIP